MFHSYKHGEFRQDYDDVDGDDNDNNNKESQASLSPRLEIPAESIYGIRARFRPKTVCRATFLYTIHHTRVL